MLQMLWHGSVSWYRRYTDRWKENIALNIESPCEFHCAPWGAQFYTSQMVLVGVYTLYKIRGPTTGAACL